MFRPVGTTEIGAKVATSVVPTGRKYTLSCTLFPAVNCWAIVERHYGANELVCNNEGFALGFPISAFRLAARDS